MGFRRFEAPPVGDWQDTAPEPTTAGEQIMATFSTIWHLQSELSQPVSAENTVPDVVALVANWLSVHDPIPDEHAIRFTDQVTRAYKTVTGRQTALEELKAAIKGQRDFIDKLLYSQVAVTLLEPVDPDAITYQQGSEVTPYGRNVERAAIFAQSFHLSTHYNPLAIKPMLILAQTGLSGRPKTFDKWYAVRPYRDNGTPAIHLDVKVKKRRSGKDSD